MCFNALRSQSYFCSQLCISPWSLITKMSSSKDDDEQAVQLLAVSHHQRRQVKKIRKHMGVFCIYQAPTKYYNYPIQTSTFDACECRRKLSTLISLVAPMLSRHHYFSRLRPKISPAERIAITLCYLATGNLQIKYRSLKCNVLPNFIYQYYLANCTLNYVATHRLSPPSTHSFWP